MSVKSLMFGYEDYKGHPCAHGQRMHSLSVHGDSKLRQLRKPFHGGVFRCFLEVFVNYIWHHDIRGKTWNHSQLQKGQEWHETFSTAILDKNKSEQITYKLKLRSNNLRFLEWHHQKTRHPCWYSVVFVGVNITHHCTAVSPVCTALFLKNSHTSCWNCCLPACTLGFTPNTQPWRTCSERSDGALISHLLCASTSISCTFQHLLSSKYTLLKKIKGTLK